MIGAFRRAQHPKHTLQRNTLDLAMVHQGLPCQVSPRRRRKFFATPLIAVVSYERIMYISAHMSTSNAFTSCSSFFGVVYWDTYCSNEPFSLLTLLFTHLFTFTPSLRLPLPLPPSFRRSPPRTNRRPRDTEQGSPDPC